MRPNPCLRSRLGWRDDGHSASASAARPVLHGRFHTGEDHDFAQAKHTIRWPVAQGGNDKGLPHDSTGPPCRPAAGPLYGRPPQISSAVIGRSGSAVSCDYPAHQAGRDMIISALAGHIDPER